MASQRKTQELSQERALAGFARSLSTLVTSFGEVVGFSEVFALVF